VTNTRGKWLKEKRFMRLQIIVGWLCLLWNCGEEDHHDGRWKLLTSWQPGRREREREGE
jgi:hypothetical protein